RKQDPRPIRRQVVVRVLETMKPSFTQRGVVPFVPVLGAGKGKVTRNAHETVARRLTYRKLIRGPARSYRTPDKCPYCGLAPPVANLRDWHQPSPPMCVNATSRSQR